MMSAGKIKEEDLYEPIRKWLIDEGYQVRAEVKSCDVVAVKEDQLLIIELKKIFNLQLVYQCIERQKLTNDVFAAVLRPPKGKRNKNFKNIVMLLRRLGIGLIFIDLTKGAPKMEIILESSNPSTKKNSKKKKGLLSEFSKRTAEYNKGGQRGKIITAYREAAVKIFFLLQKSKKSSPAGLIKMGAPPNTGNILRDNHYGWFQKISRGLYSNAVDPDFVRKDYQNIMEYFDKND